MPSLVHLPDIQTIIEDSLPYLEASRPSYGRRSSLIFLSTTMDDKDRVRLTPDLAKRRIGALSFEEWCKMTGRHRARFWRSKDFANLKRARYAHWVLRQRHWPDGAYLQDCMADLSAELVPPKRPRTKRRK
jgi:hypothetical protein